MFARNKTEQLRSSVEKSKFCWRRWLRGTGHKFVLLSKLSVIYFFITDGDQDVEEEYWVGTKYKVVDNKNIYKPNVKKVLFITLKKYSGAFLSTRIPLARRKQIRHQKSSTESRRLTIVAGSKTRSSIVDCRALVQN